MERESLLCVNFEIVTVNIVIMQELALFILHAVGTIYTYIYIHIYICTHTHTYICTMYVIHLV